MAQEMGDKETAEEWVECFKSFGPKDANDEISQEKFAEMLKDERLEPKELETLFNGLREADEDARDGISLKAFLLAMMPI